MTDQYDGPLMAQQILRLQKECDALRLDAERYRYLRIRCYRYAWPNDEHGRTMHLSFTVSGIWPDNHDPQMLDGNVAAAAMLLDGCIDAARKG
jgi:hypothetical protein